MNNKHIFLRNGRFILILLFILFALTTFTVSAAPEGHVDAVTTSHVQQAELSSPTTYAKEDTNVKSICTSFVSFINKSFGFSLPEPDECIFDGGNQGFQRGYAWSD